MVTVYTKEEFNAALKNREDKILVQGELATTMRKNSKVKKRARIGGVVILIAGIIAIPFTGGASAPIVATGMALTVGTVTITTLELVILCGFALAAIGILSGAKVTFNSDGSVTVEPKYK
jgi:hypothetical protein